MKAMPVEMPIGGPEVAQQLRMLVGNLWSAMSNRRDSDAAPLLRQLSQEIERLARRLELEGS